MPSDANDFALNCFGPYHIQIGGKEERHEISTEAPMRTVVDDDDEAVVAYLVKEHGVCIIPGSACGAPGYIRVAFANLQPDVCRVACDRLRAGLEAIMRGIH